MKLLIISAAVFFSIAANTVVKADESLFTPITEAPKSDDEEFFKVVDGEVKVEGHVIKLFVVKPEYLTASYQNNSKKSLYPTYAVKIYNRYGYLLSSGKVGVSFFGGSPQLEAGDVGGEKIRLDLIDIAPVFKHTRLKLPADFFVAAWLSLAESNTKLAAPVSPEPPATNPGGKSDDTHKPQSEADGHSR